MMFIVILFNLRLSKIPFLLSQHILSITSHFSAMILEHILHDSFMWRYGACSCCCDISTLLLNKSIRPFQQWLGKSNFQTRSKYREKQIPLTCALTQTGELNELLTTFCNIRFQCLNFWSESSKKNIDSLTVKGYLSGRRNEKGSVAS